MTESAAILLYLDGLVPKAGLVPPVGAPGRAAFLNRLVLLVAAITPSFTYGDDPARWTHAEAGADAMRASRDAAREALFSTWEAASGPGRTRPAKRSAHLICI